MKTGDKVVLKYDGNYIQGWLAIASKNGKSIMFMPDDGLIPIGEEFVNGLPLSLKDDGTFEDIFGTNTVYHVENAK